MRSRPIRVAVVDDNEDIRVLISMHLSLDDRFEFTAEATDGAEAIELLARDDIDAMVLDMHMPRVAGRHVLRAAKTANSKVRVVAFSADPQILMEAAQEGACATVLKGDTLDELFEALLNIPVVA